MDILDAERDYLAAINGEWWSGASDYQERAARACVAVEDRHTAALRAEIERLRRANAALREHAQELSAIAAKADGYALAAEVAEREVTRFKRRAEKAEGR